MWEDRDFANYIVGQADADSSFSLAIEKSSENKFGIRVYPVWKMDKYGDEEVLQKIRDFLGVGIVSSSRGKVKPYIAFRVHGYACPKLVEFFERFPLKGKKRKDFEIWKKAVQLYCARKHKGRGKDWTKDELVPLLEICEEMEMTLNRPKSHRHNTAKLALQHLSHS
jgi:hypothetical protein